MGDLAFEIFSPEDECFELVTCILKSRPSTNFPSYPSVVYLALELGLQKKEIDVLFIKIQQRIKSLFYFDGQIDIYNLPALDIPVEGTLFIFLVGGQSSIAIKTKHKIFLERDTLMKPSFLGEDNKWDEFKVVGSAVYVNFEGILYTYFLKPA